MSQQTDNLGAECVHAIIDAGDDASSSRLAGELLEELQRASDDLRVTRRRSDAQAQDLGSILEIILYAPALGILAGGLAAFLRRRPSCRIEFRNGERVAKVTDARAADAATLAKLLGNVMQINPSGDTLKS